MTLKEELATAKANLQGHQERSMHYIRQLDIQRLEIEELKLENYWLRRSRDEWKKEAELRREEL